MSRGSKEIENYDQSRNGNWYRKLASNPDSQMDALAIEYTAWVAARLQIPPPQITWFEKVDTLTGQTGWSECPFDARQQLSEENPLCFDCDYFSLPGNPGDVDVGATPVRSNTRTMIQTGHPYYCTFRSIADECYHIYQDVSRGSEWRAETNREFVEREAEEFADSLSALIRVFLQSHGVFCK
jgi:hypothetical protein